jgi:hypothetical protein
MTLQEAIAHEEGFYDPHSRSGRNHNPGDLNYGDFAQKHGAARLEVIPPGYSSKPRFAYFPDDVTGFAAMTALLRLPGKFETHPGPPVVRKLVAGYAGSTVSECLNRWAPPSDGNDTSAYEANVCKWVGCKPTDIIDHLLG